MDRVSHLMKLAEDGRKRSTTLPPLDSEPSFLRSPRKGATNTSFPEEQHHEGGKKYKKVSVDVDRKIVHHLRRDLAKRIEKRLHQLYDPNFADVEDAYDDDEHGPTQSRKQSLHERKTTIFNKYSETGDKIPDDKPQKGSSQPASRRASHAKSRAQAGASEGEANKDLQNGNEAHSGTDKDSDKELASLANGSSTQKPEGEEEKEEEREPDVNFRSLVISPVPTPVMARPETLEIPAEEFEMFVLLGKRFREKQMRFIRQSIADIEATRAERERLRQQEMETASIATTETTATADAGNMRSESIVSHREDGEDEAESTAGDSSPRKFNSNENRKEQAAIRALKDSESDIPDVAALEKWYGLDENSNPPVFRLLNIRIKKFHGRKDILTLIKSYIRSDQDIRVLVRIIGATEESSNVRTLLRSLCLQMCHVFGNNPQEVPLDYKGLVNDFEHRMRQATEDTPLVFLLDGVDCLSEEHDGRKMAWVPRELPEHACIVISTLPEERHECMPALKKILAGKDECLLEVPELPQLDAAAIVSHWLHTGNRCLTEEQFDILMDAFSKCPVPLFLKIAYNETLLWKSYTPLEQCKLADGVKKLATIRFGRLERDHGEALVRRALGYITAGRHDVNDLLMEYAADNVKTLRWGHSQFHEAARERYLDQRDKAPSYHKAMAEYFMGMWSGKPKPYTGNERGADRLVAEQDFYLEPEDTQHDGSDRVYNLRKINELPYHLLHAQLSAELKREALLNFEWILAKLCGTSLRALLEEYSTVIQMNPDDPELKLISDTLHLAGRALLQEPRQLASQLVGRLEGVIARDAPRAPGDPRKYPNLLKLVEAAKESSLPVLIPNVECLTAPGGVLFDLLSGHTDEITAVSLTSDGMRALTSSLDDTIKLWDLRTGRVVKTLEGVAVCVASEGQILVVMHEGTNTFRAWEMDNLNKLCEVDAPGERGVHKERSLLITATTYNDQVLHAFRSGNTASVQHARVTELHVNLVGSHALAVCSFEKQQTSDIAIWNLETEDHKHLARHPLVASACACLDFRFCLTAAKGQNSLRIWNLSGKVNQPAPRLKKQLGVSEVLPMQDNPRYVVAKAVNHGPISVWNVAKGKCLQAAVRVERGLTESSDAVVVRNTRLVILTDRGFSSVSEDSRPVFQTVLIYDLKAKRYEKKLTGCYIAPAPSHEYVLLDGDRLMGPSDTRTHLIIWSLVSGHAVQRIKTNFKEMERRKLEAGGVALVDSTANKTPRGSNPGQHMTPWDRRAETKSARKRRLEGEAELERQRMEELKKEKENAIEQFIISGDQKTLVASFYAHHLCVFDIESQKHTQTLENEHSLLLLHVAALTWDGSHLVHANYDERDKVSYVTLWDCGTGEVKRRLKRETDVCALGITNDASRVIIGKAPNQLHIWDPMKSNSLRRARGYDGLRFAVGSKIFMQDDSTRAVVFAGDISLWDLDKGRALAVFTPDTRILCCQAVLNGRLIAFGLYERQELIVLKLSGKNVPPLDDAGGVELFGETTGDTTDEDEDKEAGD
nr:hypothetical protein BaRGS_013593 [Batillaria attramentaria]